MIKQPYPIRRAVFVCTNKRPEGSPKPCCANNGGFDLYLKLKEELANRFVMDVGVYASSCIGPCDQGPVVLTFPDKQCYMNVSEDDIQALADELASE